MKIRKRSLAMLLAFMMTISFITGCGKNNADTKNTDVKKEKLIVWLPPVGDNDAEIWKPIVQKFGDENNCEVELEIIPWDNYAEKYATAIAANEGPDVGYMYAEMFPQFIEMKTVEDLKSYLKPEDYENYLYINDGKMMGGLYGLPIEAANPAVLYYNKDILKNLGEEAPATWEDFRRIAKKATKDTTGDGKIDQWGFAQGWGGKVFGDLNWNWYGFLWQAGGELFNEDLKSVKFNDENGQKAAQFLYDLNLLDKVVPEDSLSKKNIEMIESTFAKGKAAFAIHLASTAANMFDKSYPDLNYGFVTALKDKEQKTFASVDQLTLMSAAKNKDLAFKLMKQMLNVESMTAFHKINPRAPITKDEPYQGDPQFKEMVDKDKDIYRPLVVAPHGVEIYEYLWKQLQRMIQKQVTPKEALDEAARYGNELLQK